jgi:hypothetical protein
MMNDLTKDELQIILLDMNININCAGPLKPAQSYLALRDKIKSLVDNYESIKITKRKCPLCSSAFDTPYFGEADQTIIECSNPKCSYFQGFSL